MSDIVDKIMAYEDGQMNDTEMIEFFQELVNTGVINSLQGHYQRAARALYDAGYITKPNAQDAEVVA